MYSCCSINGVVGILCAALLLLLVVPVEAVTENSHYLISVDGEGNPGEIPVKSFGETEVVFHIGADVADDINTKISGYCLGFKVDGAAHSQLEGAYTGWPAADFDGGSFITAYATDSIRFSGFTIFGGGTPPGFSGEAFTITTTIPGSQIGQQICLDSVTLMPPSCYWKWTDMSDDVYPTWDGPHCYDIVEAPSDNAVTLERIYGPAVLGGDKIMAGMGDVTFEFRAKVDPEINDKITGLTNGFKVYTTGDVSRQPITFDFAPTFPVDGFDGMLTANGLGTDGFDADSCYFGGFTIFGDGLPVDYDEISFLVTVSVDDIDPATNPMLCLDSITYRCPGCDAWKWTDLNSDMRPTWDGPHCFPIIQPCCPACCQGTAGNVNMDPQDKVDISDLLVLIDHLFINIRPVDCLGEANLDSNPYCRVGISDVTRLVNHLFITFEPLPPCLPDCPTEK